MIKPKLKVCSGCGEEKVIWKNQGRERYCQQCWNRINPSPTRIKPMADKRVKEHQLYLGLRKVYLQEHPSCEIKLPGCTLVATEIHHTKGRIGKLLTDKRHFKATCRHCHNRVTEHSQEAIELGHSKSRLKTDPDEKSSLVDPDPRSVLGGAPGTEGNGSQDAIFL